MLIAKLNLCESTPERKKSFKQPSVSLALKIPQPGSVPGLGNEILQAALCAPPKKKVGKKINMFTSYQDLNVKYQRNNIKSLYSK